MPAPSRKLRRLWRRAPFSWRRNLPLALAFLAILVAFSIVMPLPSLQAFEGLGGEPTPYAAPADHDGRR
jgi:hypothetical protein